MPDLTIREIAGRRAELEMLRGQQREANAQIQRLEREIAYPKAWERTKFGGDIQPRRGPKRKGKMMRCTQCQREFYLRLSYLEKKPQYQYCSLHCFRASGDHREYGRRGGLEAWRRNPNLNPSEKKQRSLPKEALGSAAEAN